jgi:serine/threonine-protein kinase
VVSTLDVVASDGELFVVMEYVQGEPLSRLLASVHEAGERVPPRVVTAILAGALHGLHAAHEAKDERGEPLLMVHRDVSPQNILVGADGVPRVLDFGVAKAAGRAHTTREGQLKGKLGYMSPEQLMGKASRATDVFAASIVLWEALTGRRLFTADSEGEVVQKIIDPRVDRPSKYAPDVSGELDAVTLQGLARDPGARFATAREMARALENVLPAATASELGDFVERWAGTTLQERQRQLGDIEAGNEESPASGARPARGAEPETQLSASSDRTLGASPRGRAAIAVSAALAAAAVLVFAGMRLGARGTTSSPASVAEPTQSATSAPSAEPTSASISTAASAADTPSAPPPPAPKPVARPGRGGATRPSCAPPYTIDADGTRIYKRECAR